MLLCWLVLYFVVVEIGARWLIPRMSAGLRRRRWGLPGSLAMRPESVGGARSVLVVGNSLLLDGVVRAELRDGLATCLCRSRSFRSRAQRTLIGIFGLRRLFAEGARPGVVVVCMNFGQLISDATHGPGFAYQLMRGRDLLRVRGRRPRPHDHQQLFLCALQRVVRPAFALACRAL